MSLISAYAPQSASAAEDPAVALPNPFTPMAFFSADIAAQLTIANYVMVGITAIQIWDMLVHFVDEYNLVRRHRIRFPIIVYFISRFATLAILLGMVIINTAPIRHCDLSRKIVSIFLSHFCPEL
ncbi:hypothetical protein BDN70DRAFT_882154 [Pholiota conissans]|uniref:DUF6533 domain-containing protein n=1 Tax=Pholiota conissans TaxID=109636 RepID=A0A9P5YVU3_9AGAR|nr:hypothetical protein BDN70DRAFT_882154 [Pholiota conissans]